MAWHHYYININRLYDPGEGKEDPYIFNEHRIPPHGGIREEWITIGMEHKNAKITFVEYHMEDDDPDGVWEAYGMKAESKYSFTVNVQDADPEKLFVYALYQDGSLHTGFDVDPQKACAILTFAQSQAVTAHRFAVVMEKVKNAPRFLGAVEEIVTDELLDGRKDVPCLALFQR